MVSSIHFTLRAICCVTGRHLVEKKEKRRKKKCLCVHQKTQKESTPKKRRKKGQKDEREKEKNPCTRSPDWLQTPAGLEDVFNQRAPGVGGWWRGRGCETGHGHTKRNQFIAGKSGWERGVGRGKGWEEAGATAYFANHNPKTNSKAILIPPGPRSPPRIFSPNVVSSCLVVTW